MRLLLTSSLVVAAALVVGASVQAAPPESAKGSLPIERFVRQLSLDLRGNVPEMTDYDAVDGASDIPATLLEAYLASDEFRLQMRRYHEALLWTNPTVSLTNVRVTLSASSGPTPLWRAQGRRALYRGGDGSAECQAKPQSTIGYEPDGSPRTEDFGLVAGKPVRREGYVEVHPYWESDPSVTIKVCAFDAQTTSSFVVPSGIDAGTWPCDSLSGTIRSEHCGCGPELAYCNTSAVVTTVVSSMREQVLRSVDDHTGGGEPYSKLVTTPRAYVDGPLSHYLHYVAHVLPHSSVQTGLQPADGPVPLLGDHAAKGWVAYDRLEPHSGVLTLPAYLLRFQTQRGRANAYRIAFRGQYFEPPSAKDTGCFEVGDDLTQRCVCRGCHTTLEPLAAHFGKFSEAGSMVLTSYPESYLTRTACLNGLLPSVSSFCDRFYSVVPALEDPDIRYWKLKALQYADAQHPLVEPNFEAGPRGLAEADIASGLFHRVAVGHLFEFFMKRLPNLDVTSPDYEGATLDALAADFAKHDDLRQAITALVKLPAYRRLP